MTRLKKSLKTQFNAREAKQSFGLLLDNALQEPVTIFKHGRKVAVVISYQRFQELKADARRLKK